MLLACPSKSRAELSAVSSAKFIRQMSNFDLILSHKLLIFCGKSCFIHAESAFMAIEAELSQATTTIGRCRWVMAELKLMLASATTMAATERNRNSISTVLCHCLSWLLTVGEEYSHQAIAAAAGIPINNSSISVGFQKNELEESRGIFPIR